MILAGEIIRPVGSLGAGDAPSVVVERREMSKNIVVCCDGTANEFKRDRTNVVKLFQALVKDPVVQACYYHPGVGTMAAPGFVTKSGALTAEVAGLAFGYGLSNDIGDAYIFVCRNFEPG